MICPQCRTPNNDGDKFCEQCGSPLPVATNPPAAPHDDASLGATVLAGPSAPSVLVRLGVPGKEVYALESRAIIGRLDSCDIPINDKSVSREHARLSRLRDGYVVEDLGSTNGTLVNGVRITEAVLLRPGDLVTVGSIEFRYELEGERIHAAGEELAGSSTMVMESPPPDNRDHGFGFEYRPGPEPQHDDVPTMQEIPPVAVSFPPLEPFSAAEEAETPPPVPEKASPPPVLPPGDFRTPASSGFDMGAPPQHDLPTFPVTDREPKFAPWPPEPEGVPPSPLKPEPAKDEPGPWTFEPANIPAAPPHQEATPVASHQSGETRGTTDDAVALAEQLQSAVRDLAKQFQERDEVLARSQQRLSELGPIEQRQKTLRAILQDVPERSMTVQQLQSVQDMLDTLIQSPRDASILIKLGEQAAGLAAVVNEYGKLRRLLRRAGGEVDVPIVE